MLPLRVGCSQKSARLAQHVRAPEQAQESASPSKIDVTIKSPVGDISVVTLIRTDTTLDHSQKAEKVWQWSIMGVGRQKWKSKWACNSVAGRGGMEGGGSRPEWCWQSLASRLPLKKFCYG